MKILFLTRRFWPEIGGVETHVLEVAKRLAKEGHKITVVAENSRSTYRKNEHSNYPSAKITGKLYEIQLHNLPFYQNSWFKKFKIWWWLGQRRYLFKDADVVHCHDVFFWYLPFRFLYPFKKAYVTFHGYEGNFPPSKKAILVRKVSEKLASGNICVGDYIKKWYGTSPTYVTYGGVDVKNQKPKIKNQKHNSKLKIVLVGRLEEDIGIKIYIDALKQLKKKNVSFEFSACGDGSMRSFIERYGKAYGFVQNIRKYIEKSDIVLASSYLSILEALNCGKTVIAAYNTPLKEDYLRLAPFANRIHIMNKTGQISNFLENLSKKNALQVFSEQKKYSYNLPTWENVVGVYKKLWKIV